MTFKTLSIAATLVSMLSTSSLAMGQTSAKGPVPSPPGIAECTIKGKNVSIKYGRPSMRGRKIMGELVPFGKVWRTGANEATTLVTEVDLDIGGAKVPAGTYTLPTPDSWKLIINKQTRQWGTEYNQDQDLARVDMKKTELADPVEQFTISLKAINENSAELVLEWEKTGVSVPIKGQ